MSKAIEFHKDGYNCAESILKAINEDKQLNIPISVASPFGAGMNIGNTCGAITGALMALGAVTGRESSDEENGSRVIAREVMNKIKEKYGTFICKELKNNGVSCDEIIGYTYEVITEYVK